MHKICRSLRERSREVEIYDEMDDGVHCVHCTDDR